MFVILYHRFQIKFRMPESSHRVCGMMGGQRLNNETITFLAVEADSMNTSSARRGASYRISDRVSNVHVHLTVSDQFSSQVFRAKTLGVQRHEAWLREEGEIIR